MRRKKVFLISTASISHYSLLLVEARYWILKMLLMVVVNQCCLGWEHLVILNRWVVRSVGYRLVLVLMMLMLLLVMMMMSDLCIRGCIVERLSRYRAC